VLDISIPELRKEEKKLNAVKFLNDTNLKIVEKFDGKNIMTKAGNRSLMETALSKQAVFAGRNDGKFIFTRGAVNRHIFADLIFIADFYAREFIAKL
jgi:phosphomannomutase